MFSSKGLGRGCFEKAFFARHSIYLPTTHCSKFPPALPLLSPEGPSKPSADASAAERMRCSSERQGGGERGITDRRADSTSVALVLLRRAVQSRLGKLRSHVRNRSRGGKRKGLSTVVWRIVLLVQVKEKVIVIGGFLNQS